MTNYRVLPLSFAVVVAMTATGCQSLDLYQRYQLSRLPEDSPEHPIREVISLWEPAEGTGLDGAPCRGFAGQILFFAHGFNEPVRVDGDVTVYVFDDQGTVEEQGKPLHTFKFEKGSWEAYLRGTKTLGATYQIFIPYTRKGAQQATCTLRVKYEPKGGIPIYSKMASIILAGPESDEPEQGRSARRQPVSSRSGHVPAAVQQASYQELKDIARQELEQISASEAQTGVLTTPHPQTMDLAADRQRLQRQVQSMLQGLNAAEAEPSPQPWEPINRTIVPEPITPDPVKHPLEQ